MMALAVAWFVAFAIILFKPQPNPMWLLYISLAWILATVEVLLCGRAANRRMYDHPERLAKRSMALNKEICADFTPCGLDRIHVGSKR